MAAVLAACGGTAETGNYTALEITSSGSAETVVTINGQRLETKNRVYEEGLRFVDMLD